MENFKDETPMWQTLISCVNEWLPSFPRKERMVSIVNKHPNILRSHTTCDTDVTLYCVNHRLWVGVNELRPTL